ncbi:MAG TPA: hypothetical protein VFW40_09735 [Capsulimonadaceae bacterium]|nr:hypothetical protein [Capsulimonadaceae bacterium]
MVDWADGIATYSLDGSSTPSRVNYAFRFDSAQALPGTPYVVIYERLGTKGLILREGKVLREINRSYYHAAVYDCPISLFHLPDGRAVIAHCPDKYCRIEIEELETGERLTRRDNKPLDFFHSRLQSSRDGQYLLSAGWYWHPLDFVKIFSISEVLAEPEKLETGPKHIPCRPWVELNNACFFGHDAVIVTGRDYDAPDEDEDMNIQKLESNEVGVYSLIDQRFLSTAKVEEPTGTLMPVGESFVLGLYEHPKLIELATGRVVARWPQIESGKQNSSIHFEKLPPIALDPKNHRFAVADSEQIVVVQLGE